MKLAHSVCPRGGDGCWQGGPEPVRFAGSPPRFGVSGCRVPAPRHKKPRAGDSRPCSPPRPSPPAGSVQPAPWRLARRSATETPEVWAAARVWDNFTARGPGCQSCPWRKRAAQPRSTSAPPAQHRPSRALCRDGRDAAGRCGFWLPPSARPCLHPAGGPGNPARPLSSAAGGSCWISAGLRSMRWEEGQPVSELHLPARP